MTKKKFHEIKLKAEARNFVEWGDVNASAEEQRAAWARLEMAALEYAHAIGGRK